MTDQVLFDANPTLHSVLTNNSTWDQEGNEIVLSSGITARNAQRLHSVIFAAAPRKVLEIGMAHGISTVSILTALTQHGEGSLTSIDPFESTQWQGAGVKLVEKCGFSEFHQLIEKPDFIALPSLLQSNHAYDVAYIDGMHSFEHTFLNFFYIDRMLDAGGLVGFNDCGMPAVQKVIKYIASHLSYEEHLAMPVSWREKRRLRFWEFPDRWFRKVENKAVPWDFYADF